MYLSRLWLNPRDRAVQRDLTDLQAMHRTLMSASPPLSGQMEPRAKLGVLFRQEEDPHSGDPFVLVQSRLLPNWGSLPPRYLSPAFTKEPICKSLLSLLEVIQMGRTFRFRLRANPTKKVAARNAPDTLHEKGRRVDLRKEEDQRAWLERKGKQHGFDVRGLRVNDEPRLTSRFSNRGGSGPIVIAPVLYEGILQVTDAAALRRTLEVGIGPGKAYGCGLLSIAPYIHTDEAQS